MGRGGKYNVPSLPQLGDRCGGNSALQNNSDLAHGPVGRPSGRLTLRQPPEGGPPMSGMGRREFMALLAGAAAWPLAAHAQQAGSIPRIGVLWPGDAPPVSPRMESFRQGLRASGFV